MGRLLPDSLTWRFALLLAAALIAANVVAGVLLSTQRQRLDDAAREAREIERITSLVPALEAVSRSAWRAIERDASTRFSRIRITESPVVEATASDARSRELAQRIMEALPGRSVAVAVVDRSKWYSFRRRAGDRHETGADEPDTIAVSVALDPGAGAERAEAWLNLMSFAPRHMRGEARPGAMLTILVLSLVAVLGAGLLLVWPFGQGEDAMQPGLHTQIARRPDIWPAFGEEQVDFGRPAPDTLDLDKLGNGQFIIARQVMQVDATGYHQLGETARIALFLAGKAARTQGIEILLQQALGRATFAQ